ncbi:MAG TPA: GntR family transcriptional regulator [Rhodospirillaceae bacterium]|nr:GntR family transcriptional regulator [Rhodospirillaceae bacterium]
MQSGINVILYASNRPRGAPLSDRKTRTERIRDELADEIARGRLGPGAALDEVTLADRFGVSRTPIREAIRQLEAFGFADARPRRGAVVATITDERLDEMFLVMAEMEGLCSRIAADNMTPADHEGLLQIHEGSRLAAEADDVERYYELNTQFHACIYSGTHNSFLEELTLHVRRRVAPYRRAQFRVTGRLDLSYREHDAVVQAILRGDGEGAQQAMNGHLKLVRGAVHDITEP